jgi:hypothetical protein
MMVGRSKIKEKLTDIQIQVMNSEFVGKIINSESVAYLCYMCAERLAAHAKSLGFKASIAGSQLKFPQPPNDKLDKNRWTISHAVAIVEVDDKVLVLDQPQQEFIKRPSMRKVVLSQEYLKPRLIPLSELEGLGYVGGLRFRESYNQPNLFFKQADGEFKFVRGDDLNGEIVPCQNLIDMITPVWECPDCEEKSGLKDWKNQPQSN